MFPEDANQDTFLNMEAKRTVSNCSQKVAFSTYPRCGSSFFRKFFQLITGTASGSDMLLEFVVDMQLNQNKGEEICDDSIWLFKSHDPLPIKQSLKIAANKVLCCVRNPFDTIASSFVFSLTQNQGV